MGKLDNLVEQVTKANPVIRDNLVQMASLATTESVLPVQEVRLVIPAFLAKTVNPETTAFPEHQGKMEHPVAWEVLEHRV